MSSDPPIPSTTAPNALPSTTDPTRGIPYYESLRRSLRETLTRKTLLDKSLLSLETSLYRAETLYLEDTGAGNIIRGFDNYIKGTTASSSSLSGGGAGGGGGGGGGAGGGRKRGGVGEGDRVFSKSSVGFAREVSPEEGLREEGEEEEEGVGRRRRKGEEEGEGERGPKRLKITYARGERGGE